LKKILYIQDTLANKISYYHILLFLIYLPFDRFYSELLLISFTLHTFLHIRKHPFTPGRIKQMLLLQSVFILSVLGLAYTSNRQEALELCERQLAIALFPLLLCLTKLDIRKYKDHFLTTFAITCVIAMLYLYADAFHIIVYNKLPLQRIFTRAFLNHNFSDAIEMHATYFAMYAFVSLVIVWSLFVQATCITVKVFCGLGMLILFAGLVQLASKAAFVALLICLYFLFPLFIQNTRKRIQFILTGIGLSVILLVFICGMPDLKERFITEFRDDIQQAPNSAIAEPRIERWAIAVQLIKQSPVVGHGTAAENLLLKDAYFNRKMYVSFLMGLNTHDQYLSIAINHGIVGLLVFLFTLYVGFQVAIQKKDRIFLCFMVLLFVVSLSENILNLNKGIFFYAFFFSLFLMTSVQSTNYEVQST